MRIRQVFGFTFAILMVFTLFASVGSAQIQRPLRWLGHGYSDGYNRCNPGPNSDYYNPYSAHNSHLVSRNPFGSGPQTDQYQGPTQPGVPFSAYAAPQPINENAILKQLPGDSVENTFEPYDPDDIDAKKEDESTEDSTDELNDQSAFIPTLRGHLTPSSQTPPAGFSNAGFQTQPIQSQPLGRVNSSNLFDPFGENSSN